MAKAHTFTHYMALENSHKGLPGRRIFFLYTYICQIHILEKGNFFFSTVYILLYHLYTFFVCYVEEECNGSVINYNNYWTRCVLDSKVRLGTELTALFCAVDFASSFSSRFELWEQFGRTDMKTEKQCCLRFLLIFSPNETWCSNLSNCILLFKFLV